MIGPLKIVLENRPDFPPQNLNLCFLQKCADIMPVYIDDEKEMQYTQRLRPEFVAEYQKPLNADSFLATISTQESEEDDLAIMEAAKYLKNEKVAQLIEKLETLEYLPVDSTTLTWCFHKMGVNMRLLGEVCTQSTLPHIKEICLCDMVSRVCKKVFRNNIADLLKTFRNQLMTKISLPRQSLNLSLIQELDEQDIYDRAAILKQVIYEFIKAFKANKVCLESCLDFLNLIFGHGNESNIFWQQIIQKQVWYDYHFQFDSNKRQILFPKGLLFQSILYQCDIQFTQPPQIFKNIFNTQLPFTNINGLLIIKRANYYQLNKSLINKTLKQTTLYMNQQEFEMAEFCTKQAIILAQMQHQLNYESEGITQNISDKIGLIQAEQTELRYVQKNYTLAIQKSQEALGCIQQFHVHALKPIQVIIKSLLMDGKPVTKITQAIEYFEQACEILDTHLGEHHPLYSTLYCVLAYHYKEGNQYEDALNLYKSSLLCSLRVLGSSHPQTGAIYSDIGNLYGKMGFRKEALENLFNARTIYEASNHNKTMDYSRNQLNIAYLQYEQGMHSESLTNLNIATDINEQFEYEYPLQLINCYTLKIQLLAQFDNVDQQVFIEQINSKTIETCELLYQLMERHQILEQNQELVKMVLDRLGR